MASLSDELKSVKNNLSQFESITIRVLRYLPDVISNTTDVEGKDYIILTSDVANTKKILRPINTKLFLSTPKEFKSKYDNFLSIVNNLKKGVRSFQENDYYIIDKTVYTIQQSMGIGFDLVSTPNSARKHVGNRFEELIRTILITMGVPTKKIVLSIPYETESGIETYRCETDVVISPYSEIKSTSDDIHQKEIVISLKTTTKDRMGKIFTDKILMRKFLKHDIKMVGISLNDVQRKEKDKISYTFVPNLFMVYTNILSELEGYYYLDLPPRAKESPFNKHISAFSNFIIEDIWRLLNT